MKGLQRGFCHERQPIRRTSIGIYWYYTRQLENVVSLSNKKHDSIKKYIKRGSNKKLWWLNLHKTINFRLLNAISIMLQNYFIRTLWMRSTPNICTGMFLCVPSVTKKKYREIEWLWRNGWSGKLSEGEAIDLIKKRNESLDPRARTPDEKGERIDCGWMKKNIYIQATIDSRVSQDPELVDNAAEGDTPGRSRGARKYWPVALYGRTAHDRD